MKAFLFRSNIQRLLLFSLMFVMSSSIWAAGGGYNTKLGCETIRVFEGRLFPFPMDQGGSSLEIATKNCDGKTDLYILQLAVHAQCYLRNSPVHLTIISKGSNGEDLIGYLDFDYEYVFKPTIKIMNFDTLDYCVAKSMNVETFKESEASSELRVKVSAALTSAPYNYKITKQLSGTNFKKAWTHYSSNKDTHVIFVAVANKQFQTKHDHASVADDLYLTEDGELVYKNTIVAVLLRGSEIVLVKPVLSVGEVIADADGDGFPEVVYEYDDSENSNRDLTEIKPNARSSIK